MSKDDLKNISKAVNNTLFAEINHSAIDTWLEPYIGWKFKVIKKGKRSTSVRWWGKIEYIPNKRINFR